MYRLSAGATHRVFARGIKNAVRASLTADLCQIIKETMKILE